MAEIAGGSGNSSGPRDEILTTGYNAIPPGRSAKGENEPFFNYRQDIRGEKVGRSLRTGAWDTERKKEMWAITQVKQKGTDHLNHPCAGGSNDTVSSRRLKTSCWAVRVGH